jgi:hypothetical protein
MANILGISAFYHDSAAALVVDEPLYVDQIHYTPPFAHDIAERIAGFLKSSLPSISK